MLDRRHTWTHLIAVQCKHHRGCWQTSSDLVRSWLEYHLDVSPGFCPRSTLDAAAGCSQQLEVEKMENFAIDHAMIHGCRVVTRDNARPVTFADQSLTYYNVD